MIRSESITKLATALFKAQFDFTGAVKDSNNPFYNSSYANLESVWDAIKKPLHDNELSVLQPHGYENDKFGVYTIIIHSSGEFIQGFTPVHSKDNSAQAVGSGISYARRYALASMVGVYQVDDDANNADGLKPDTMPPQAPIKPQAPKPIVNHAPQAAAPKTQSRPLSDAQINRLHAIARNQGYNPIETAKLAKDKFNVTDYKSMSKADYDSFVNYLEANRKV